MEGWQVTPIDGVEIRYEWAGWRLTVGWPQRVRIHDVVALIKIEYVGADRPRLVLSTTRINLLSDSAKEGLVRRMAYGRDDDRPRLARLVHEVAEDAMGHYRQAGRMSFPKPAPREPGGWILYPIWPSTGATIVAAAPDSFKSVLAEAAATQATTGVEILEGNTRPPPEPLRVVYCDWEADEVTFSERLHGLIGDTDPGHLAYREMRTPLTDIAAGLAEELTRGRFDAVVIDSMSAAIGGSMVDDDVSNRFWDAVRTLGVPALVLAHKSMENIRKRRAAAFGSVMQWGRPRIGWNAERAEEGTTVRWEVYKDNNTGRRGMTLAWELTFDLDDEEERTISQIRIAAVNPTNVAVKVAAANTVADQTMYALLEAGSLLPGEIAKEIDAKVNTVRQALARNDDLFWKQPDGRWTVKPDPT